MEPTQWDSWEQGGGGVRKTYKNPQKDKKQLDSSCLAFNKIVKYLKAGLKITKKVQRGFE